MEGKVKKILHMPNNFGTTFVEKNTHTDIIGYF